MRMASGAKARSILAVAAILLVMASLADAKPRGRKYKPPPPTCNLRVVVVDGAHGKPIANADVIFHPVRRNKVEGSLELKSDTNGVAKINVIPVGDTLLLQVIKPGWNTFGKEYKIDTASKEIVVKMQPPTSQYSIYTKPKPSQSGQNAENVTPKGESTSAEPNGQVPVPR